jgi:hypothetical protein
LNNPCNVHGISLLPSALQQRQLRRTDVPDCALLC